MVGLFHYKLIVTEELYCVRSLAGRFLDVVARVSRVSPNQHQFGSDFAAVRRVLDRRVHAEC